MHDALKTYEEVKV